jgi:hypothetical protein
VEAVDDVTAAAEREGSDDDARSPEGPVDADETGDATDTDEERS